MSVTVTSQSTDEPSVDDDDQPPAFDSAVWERPGICNGCFALLKRDGRRIADGEAGHDKEEYDDYGIEALYPEKTVCSQCGSISGRANDETLSREAMLQRVPALAERLREAGYAPDSVRLYHFVDAANDRRDLQGQDTEIFRRAVAFALS